MMMMMKGGAVLLLWSRRCHPRGCLVWWVHELSSYDDSSYAVSNEADDDDDDDDDDSVYSAFSSLDGYPSFLLFYDI